MKKTRKLLPFIITLAMGIMVTFVFSACDETYTTTETDALVLQLQSNIDGNKSELDGKIAILTEEYKAKDGELLGQIEANQQAITALQTEYTIKIAKLELADEVNKNAIADLTREYQAKVKELENAIATANATIERNKTELNGAISALSATYEAKITEINELLDVLRNTDTTQDEKIAELVSKITALEQATRITDVKFSDNGDLIITFGDGSTQKVKAPGQHIHTFGDWKAFTVDEVPCENRLFFHTCVECNAIEWKQGTYIDHDWKIVTTAPTCQEQGYDTKTCSICGKEETENYTQTNEHQWKDAYSFDNSFHWFDCRNCDSKSEYVEHDMDNSGYCIICNQPLLPTEGIVYDISADGTYAEVIEYTGTATKIKIADTYQGLPVETIYDSVFAGREDIVSVSLPTTLKSIGYMAFSQTGLTEITLPEGLTNIGRGAFSFCPSLTTIYFNSTECSTGLSGFYMDDVSFAPFVGTIGYNQKGEINIFISRNVKFIDSCMFAGGKGSLYGNLGCKVYFENESVCERIEAFAFYCSVLKSINIPSNVTSIGKNAFTYCALTEIELPSGLTGIGNGAFFASGLQKIVIPEGVKSIGYGVLEGIPNVELPNSLESIDNSAFGSYYVNNGTFFDDTNLQFNEYENCLYLGNKTNPYLVLMKAKNTNYSTYKIHSDTKLIFYEAFFDCTRMTTCVIGKNLKYIDDITYGSYGSWQYNFPDMSKIYYEGTVQGWESSEISNKSYFKNAEMYYYSEEEPALNASKTDYDGNYWKYNENGEIVVWVYNKEENL